MPDLPAIPDDDDALADLIADALVTLAQQPGRFRKAALHMAGLTEPKTHTLQQTAALLGTSEPSVRRIERRALLKLRRASQRMGLIPGNS